jgi:hypothetical protein
MFSEGETGDAKDIKKIISEIESILQTIHNLPPDEKEKLDEQYGILVSDFCNIVKGNEKTALCDEEIFNELADCKHIGNKYTPKGTLMDVLYLENIVQIAKTAKSLSSKFYLEDDILFLFHKDLNLHECIRKSDTLLLGERDFSFASSYRITHKNVNLIASEYELLYPDSKNLAIDFNSALSYLLKNEVIIAYGVDATKLHEYKVLADRDPFKRIQFNCPYDYRDGTEGGALEKTYTKQLVDSFMASAKKLLKGEGRLHISIQQPECKAPGKWGKREYQKAYGLPQSALTHEFELVKVMGNIQKRYDKKISAVLEGKEEQSKIKYSPFLGVGKEHRVNQFIFKFKDKKDWLVYSTDNGTDSESDLKKEVEDKDSNEQGKSLIFSRNFGKVEPSETQNFSNKKRESDVNSSEEETKNIKKQRLEYD